MGPVFWSLHPYFTGLHVYFMFITEKKSGAKTAPPLEPFHGM